jgi:hypothetical protein
MSGFGTTCMTESPAMIDRRRERAAVPARPRLLWKTAAASVLPVSHPPYLRID